MLSIPFVVVCLTLAIRRCSPAARSQRALSAVAELGELGLGPFPAARRAPVRSGPVSSRARSRSSCRSGQRGGRTGVRGELLGPRAGRRRSRRGRAPLALCRRCSAISGRPGVHLGDLVLGRRSIERSRSLMPGRSAGARRRPVHLLLQGLDAGRASSSSRAQPGVLGDGGVPVGGSIRTSASEPAQVAVDLRLVIRGARSAPVPGYGHIVVTGRSVTVPPSA
ncbi:hypothetical protein HBB16_14790 [Pseudonocardia sp. MCCB 268]|nr:hypothetical protein [Pseudonocardia cytotoxica]